MVDEPNGDERGEGGRDEQPQSLTPPQVSGAPPQGEGIRSAHENETEHKTEDAVERAVKRELRIPEWIMAIFTIAIFCSAAAQCHEMQTGGIDTHNLASATQALASEASAQLEINEAAASAAASQASSTREMATAQSEQLSELRSSVGAAKEAADAAFDQAHTARDALVADSRAWIAFQSADTIKYSDNKYSVSIHFINIGKTPALDLVDNFVSDGGNVPNIHNLDDVRFGYNSSCEGVQPSDGGYIAYPQQSQRDGVDINVSPIPTGSGTIVLRGCFVYRTLKRVHTTKFCVFTEPSETKPFESRIFKYCADGNHTD